MNDSTPFFIASWHKPATAKTLKTLHQLKWVAHSHNLGVLMKKAFIITIATAAICLLSACAAGWHKQGVSDYDTENALSQCEYEAGINHVDRGDFVSNCMKRQGFRWF